MNRIGAVALICLAGASALSEAQTAESAKHWDAFIASFIETHFTFHPTAAVYEGRHEFDGQMPDWSKEGLAREVAWLKQSRASAQAFDPASLDAPRRIERKHLLASIEANLFWLEDARWPFTNPSYYEWQLDPAVYLTRDYAPLETRMAAYIGYANAIPRSAEQIRANIETPMPKTYAELGQLIAGGMASFYRDDVPTVFASVEDSDLQERFAAANERAAAAMDALDAWFGQEAERATDDFAMGPELFSRMLRATEMVDIPLDRLKAIGERDLARNLEALREACARLDPDKTIEECIELVQSQKPAGGPVAAAREQLHELKSFVVERGLVTIPGDEEAQVDEAPPYRRYNLAYIDVPGAYEEKPTGTYYIAPPDPSWTPEEQAAYIPGEADLLAVSVHEVWPGHFLQFMHSRRAKSEFGRLFVTYAFAEGWAHYTEELMVNEGLRYDDPATRIGQLLNALLRNVRFISAIGLHTEGMTVEESERLFLQNAYQSAGHARQQAARGTFDPQYLNYTMGKLMIRKLREDWIADRGGREAYQEFHDSFLSFGGPPIPLIREAMLGPGSGPPL